MNRPLAHLLGWASLAIGAALIAAIVLTPPWLDLHYTHWERGFIEACAKTQAEQVEAYEHFASALSSNDPVLLQRLAYHHLRLKPSYTDFVSLPKPHDADLLVPTDERPQTLGLGPVKTTLIEDWLHKPHPVVGIDYPPYEAPEGMFIRLATGPKRLILLALGGVFLLCGLILPGPPRVVVDADEEEESVEPEIDSTLAWARDVEPVERITPAVLESPAPATPNPVSAPAPSTVIVAPAAAPTVPPPQPDPQPPATAPADEEEDFVAAVIDIDEDEPSEVVQTDPKNPNDEDEEHPATA